MPHISPFIGLLYDRSRVGPLERVTAPPYDTMSPAEQLRYLGASPYNVARLDLGEERSGDDEAENKYRRASEELRRWRAEGILVQAAEPAYYPYEMRFSLHGRRRRVRGLVCAVELEDWGGSIVPHERTMRGPVDDRLRLIREVRSNLSCIHAVFFGPFAPLAAALERTTRLEPLVEVTDDQEVEHRMWASTDDGGARAWLAGQRLLIADGHHRYAMALRYRDEMRAAHGPGPWDQTMMLVMDAATERPPVLPYHRLLRGEPPPVDGHPVPGLDDVLARVDDDALAYGAAIREAAAVTHRVSTLEGEPPTVCALHDSVLRGRDGDLTFTPDAGEADRAVREGRADAAFFLPPTSAERIRSVIDRGDRLPPKSTYFWPKPRTGMVIRPLDPPA